MSPASETRTSKRLMPGSSGRADVIQTMRASTKRRPRARRRLRWTWSPPGSGSAPNQRVPLGSRVGSRGVRVRVPPGQSQLDVDSAPPDLLQEARLRRRRDRELRFDKAPRRRRLAPQHHDQRGIMCDAAATCKSRGAARCPGRLPWGRGARGRNAPFEAVTACSFRVLRTPFRTAGFCRNAARGTQWTRTPTARRRGQDAISRFGGVSGGAGDRLSGPRGR